MLNHLLRRPWSSLGAVILLSCALPHSPEAARGTSAALIDPHGPSPPNFDDLVSASVLPSEEAGRPAGTFAVNDEGAATYTYPIWVPPGRRGVQPQLSLRYSSQNKRVGHLGVGWSLSGISSIRRCPRDPARDGATTGVRFQNDDGLCMGNQRLVLVSGNYGASGSEYRLERDGHVRITLDRPLGNHQSLFRVEHPNGGVSTYRTPPSQYRLRPDSQQDPTLHERVAPLWALVSYQDALGNYMEYRYDEYFHQVTQTWDYRISEILYTGHPNRTQYDRRVWFEYRGVPQRHPDVQYVAGYGTGAVHLLAAIHSSGPAGPARTLRFDYRQSDSTKRSLLTSITDCDFAQKCLDPIVFDYHDQTAVVIPGLKSYGTTIPTPVPIDQVWSQSNMEGLTFTAGDFDGNGQDDFLVREPRGHYYQFRAYLRNDQEPSRYDTPVLTSLGELTDVITTDNFNHDGKKEIINWVLEDRQIKFNLYDWTGNDFVETVNRPGKTGGRYVGVKPPWRDSEVKQSEVLQTLLAGGSQEAPAAACG